MTNIIDFTARRNEVIETNRAKIAEKISDIVTLVINISASTIISRDKETIKRVLSKAHKTLEAICDDLNKHTAEGSPQITIENLFGAGPLQAIVAATIASQEPDKIAPLVLTFAKECGYSDKTIATAEAALGCIIR